MQDDHVQIRLALPSKRRALEARRTRASLGNAGDRDALLGNPDAIDPPLEQIEAGHVVVLETAGRSGIFSTTTPHASVQCYSIP